MRLFYLQEGKYSVLGEILTKQGEDFVGILEDFKKADAQYIKSITGFTALFKRFSDKGQGSLPKHLFHKPDADDDLYQFIKGDLRLICFFNDSGNAVVLSHYEVKKGDKLPQKALNKARKLRKQYHIDQKAGKIKFFDEKDGKLIPRK